MIAARALACALLLALPACDGCGAPSPSVDSGAARPTPSATQPADETLTPAGRAAAYARAVPEERERASRRATLLADGRRYGRAGQHAQALRSFEDALGDAKGPDASLHCEAGYQAIRLGQWPLARRHLEAGLTVAIQPRRRAACLFNLALVDEAEQDHAAAIAALRESLMLRPNGTVERKLHALEAALAEAESSESADVGAAEPNGAPTLEALCSAPECTRTEIDLPTPPAEWPELAFVTREAQELPLLDTWLVAKGPEGWRNVAVLTSDDERDTYGVEEATEDITGVRFDEGQLVVSVAGSLDENDDEAEHYFECEAAHPGDDDALMDCFGEATADLPPPESWAFELFFELVDGLPVLAERRVGSATQVPSDESTPGQSR